MFAQFFGNYLLNRHAISTDQFLSAAKKLHSERLRIGTLAMHAGYMTGEEVNQIIILQTHKDRRFGEIAIEQGYLTLVQLDNLLKMQTPDYLLFGQILVDEGYLNYVDLKTLLLEYQKENELKTSDLISQYQGIMENLIENCFKENTLTTLPKEFLDYLNLLLNNLIRFIGEDFTLLNPHCISNMQTHRCTSQSITGNFSLRSMIDMEEDTASIFASRYTGESFLEFDEYVQASLDDFLNLHNGLFIVNASNESSLELTLTPPINNDLQLLNLNKKSFVLPIIYPFGNLNFIFQLT